MRWTRESDWAERSLVLAHRPSESNKHPAIILGVRDDWFVVATGTSKQRRDSSPVVEVTEGSRFYKCLGGLTRTTYFYADHVYLVQRSELQVIRNAKKAPPGLYMQLRELVTPHLCARGAALLGLHLIEHNSQGRAQLDTTVK